MNAEVLFRRRGWKSRLAAASGSLKLRITLGAVVALALGIGLITALLVRQAEHDTLAAQRQRELAEGVHTAAGLSRRVVDMQRSLQANATRLDPATLADDAALAVFIDTQPVLGGMFASLFASGTDGRLRVFADAAGVRRSEVSIADRPYFRRTLAERRAIVSDAVEGRVSGHPVIVLCQPLTAGGQVYGVLGGAIHLTGRDLLGDIADGSDTDNGTLLVVTDVQGRLLAHPDPKRLLQSLSTEPRLAQAFAEWVAGGSAVEPAGLLLAQPGELVSAAGVAGPDWMVWRAVPQAELLAPLHAARRQALLWACALIALVSGAMLLLLWSLLRPLTLLEHRAGHLFDGSSDPELGWPISGGEIGRLVRVLRHVGVERAQLEVFNARLLKQMGSVMSAAPVGIAFTRAERFELASAECCRLLGYAEQDLIGQPSRIIYASDADYAALGPEVSTAFGAGQPYVGEWEMVRADGSHFWGCVRASPVDAGDAAAGTIWTLNDIGDQIAARRRLEWSATHDALTGLANRKVLDRRLAGVFDAMPRTIQAAVVMIDLDRFKPVNDTAGHAAGDAMLRLVAAAIADCVRASDLVVRLGGDEFALLLERCPPEVAIRIAEQVQAAISAIVLPWQHHTLRVSASLGLAMLTAETPDCAAWLGAADAACYRAKAEGRGTVRTSPRPALAALPGAVAAVAS